MMIGFEHSGTQWMHAIAGREFWGYHPQDIDLAWMPVDNKFIL
jgi:hypothetical protein